MDVIDRYSFYLKSDLKSLNDKPLVTTHQATAQWLPWTGFRQKSRKSRRSGALSDWNSSYLSSFFILLLLLAVTPISLTAQGLPSGYGWHVLANTPMSSVCVGNLANGMFSDATMTTTTTYDFNCNEVVPWSGGAIDDAHQRLIVWGGGHSDYAGDEVFVLNLSGTPSWQLLTNPTTPVPYVADGNNWEGLSPYYVRLSDGGHYQAGAAPASRHTYNGLQYVPYQNKLYSFGGAVANVGFFSSEVWALDMTSKSWTMVGPPFSKSPGYPTSAYNPSNGHIVMHDKNWSLFDYDPHTNAWTTLTTSYHIDDGTTAAIDPVNNLLVVVGSAGTADNTSYPSLPTSHTVQVFLLSAPYTMQSWSAAGCDLTYRSGGLAWDSALGLMVGYPGGGNQFYFLNTGPNPVVTPFGSVPSHQCLDVPISPNPTPVKGIDYPPDPEGSSRDANFGIYGRFEYVPSLDVFVVMNDHTQDVWILRLAGGSPEPDYALSESPNSLTVVAGGAAATATITTKISGGFQNPVVLSSAGAPAGLSINLSPGTIAAPGAGTSTVTVSASAVTPTGTYPIVISGLGGGDTHTSVLSVTVTSNAPPTLSISAAPSTLTVAQGTYGSSSITTTIGGSFNSAVSLSASGVPTGTTVTFNPSSIPAPGAGTSTMTINVGANTSVGTYPITVTATGGGLSSNTPVNLTVTSSQNPSLTVGASPVSLSLAPGTAGTSTITTTVAGGFNSAVSLSATGTPLGTTVSFNPSTVPAPGAGTSVMTLSVGANTAPGTYAITVTAAGGGLAPTTTVSLIVQSMGGFQQGFNFRATAAYVSDPSNTTHVLATTTYPTKVGGVTFGWLPGVVQSRDRSKSVDPRLAGINYVSNGTPAQFQVDLPSPGTYIVSLALGDDGYGQCSVRCQVQFLDGNTNLGAVAGGMVPAGNFYDDADNKWSAATWPASNVSKQITMAGTHLTVVVGTTAFSGDVTPVAFLGISQQSGSNSDFTVTASPAALTVSQGSQGASTITTGLIGSFNNAISLSATGAPSGTTVSFNPVTISAPGAGTSTMTISVGANTAPGTYPITVTAAGGGIQHNTTVNLTVTTQLTFQQGFNFRATAGYVSDPSNTTHVMSTTAYPTKVGNITFGWLKTSLVQSRDRSKVVDPRLAGINYVSNGTPAQFQVDLPAPGTYLLSLAMGDAAYGQCWTRCQIQFLDGNTNVGTVAGGTIAAGYFYDDATEAWSAAAWPANNISKQVTMTGTHLTVVVGTNSSSGDLTPISFLGISQGMGNSADFTVTASPSALSVAQGSQGSSTITTSLIGSFNGAISLSARGVPSGTTVAFNPTTIPAPGAGTSAMTISVGANTATGTYPITVTGAGNGIQHATTVTLTVTAQSGLTVSANPASLSIQQGTQESSNITTVIRGGFNSQVALAAMGVPSSTTVSFNPSAIPAPGAGTSVMTITVGSNTVIGTYPITVTASGGGLTATIVVSLTVTPSGGSGGNSITVSDLSGYGQSNRPITIGRFFRQGDIPQFAQAVVGNTPLLTQCDVKNRWPDGSLKFAIISFVLPSVSTGGTAVAFQNQSTGNNTGYLQQGDMLDKSYDFDAVMNLTGTVSPSISARSMLQGGQFRYWLQGPIVTAVIVEDRIGRTYDVNTDGVNGNPLHPMFEAWFYPQGKKVEVGFTLENAWSSSTSFNSARNQTFAVSLTTGYAAPATRLTQPTFTEWAFTRWRRAFWIDSDPQPVQFNWNPQYLVTTGAYPVYDMNYLPNSSVVNAEYATYNNFATNYPARLTIAGFDDPNHGGVVNYDEAINAGGDSNNGSWIGLFPTWDIDYLLTGDPRLQKQMTDNADLAARFPIWFREADHNAGSGGYFDYPHSGTVDPYGHLVSINARQQVTLDWTNWHPGCAGEAPDNINAGAPLYFGGWPGPATSHLPDFGFVPYSLTGKYYYLEQEEMEAGYAVGFRVGCYNLVSDYWRQGYLGMLELLVRDQAWAMRALANAAFLAPDGDPEGPYFKDKVLNNIARMEGEHGLTLDITDTSDRSVAYQWGFNTAIYTQATNPSPLGAWDVDGAAYSYAQDGSDNNVNPNTLKAAGSMFQEAFMNVTLGMTRQLGIANTKELLTFAAKRPFHMLLDPSVNHYLIGQYCYPSQYTNGSWVADWPNFQANYLVLPTRWGQAQTTDDIRGFQQMSGVSFMTDITVDGFNGQAVWNWFKANKPNQSEFQTVDPRWSITPFH